jgi:hypothetical protein
MLNSLLLERYNAPGHADSQDEQKDGGAKKKNSY